MFSFEYSTNIILKIEHHCFLMSLNGLALKIKKQKRRGDFYGGPEEQITQSKNILNIKTIKATNLKKLDFKIKK